MKKTTATPKIEEENKLNSLMKQFKKKLKDSKKYAGRLLRTFIAPGKKYLATGKKGNVHEAIHLTAKRKGDFSQMLYTMKKNNRWLVTGDRPLFGHALIYGAPIIFLWLEMVRMNG